MIIELTTEQAEWVEFALANLSHDSLAKRFETNRALVTETEVQLILEALEEEKFKIEYHLSEDDPVEYHLSKGIPPTNEEEEEEEKEEKALLWDLEVIGSAIDSLQSQLKGGQPIQPKESDN